MWTLFLLTEMSEERGSGASTGVSFSGLLNAIDGVACKRGPARQTTNYPEKRLCTCAPWQVRHQDRAEEGVRAQMRNLFLRFFECESALADNSSNCLNTDSWKPGHMLSNRHDVICGYTKTAARVRQQVKMSVRHLPVGARRLSPLFTMHGYEYKSGCGIKSGLIKEWDRVAV